MKQVVIENPILNSPLDEPRRQFCFPNQHKKDKAAKARTPLHRDGFGRSAFIEIEDPWDAESVIRSFVETSGGQED